MFVAQPHSWRVRSSSMCVLAVLLATLFPISAAAAPTAQSSTPAITILPINGARLLAGQRVDLRVEASNVAANTDASTFRVAVNGQPLAAYFGKAPVASNASTTSAELTLRQVMFSTPGTYRIDVSAAGSSTSVTYTVVQPQATHGRAKNVILLIGDGMSWQMLTIARTVSKGLTQGTFNGTLEMDRMQQVGYVTTSGYDSLDTDSANSASAYATGNKSVVNAMGVYADNTTDTLDDPRVENILEILKRSRNMATGLVTTAEIEDATPAAMFAHTRRRAEKQYIADQLLDDPLHRPDVVMGGGSAYFIPQSTKGSSRKDDRDLYADFRNAGYNVVGTQRELNAVGTPQRLLGLFHPGNLNTWIDREYTKNPDVLKQYTDQPTLYNMTSKALDVLANTPNGRDNGFFVMIEGASIDKQLHPMDWQRATGEMIEFDKSVGVAKQFAAQRNDTLVIVVADHGHSVSLFGTYDTAAGPGKRDAVGVYADAGFPDFVDRGDGFPVTWEPTRTLAVGFGNHPDYRDDYLFNPTPANPTVADPNNKDVFVPNPDRDPQGITLTGNLPFKEDVEVHSADDVPLLTSGPGSAYFAGIHDNTDLFFGMMDALGIDARVGTTPTHESTGTLPPTGIVLPAARTNSWFVGLGVGGVLAGLFVLASPRATRRIRRAHAFRPARRVGRALRAAWRSFGQALRDD